MQTNSKILAFAGSTRNDSLNKKLVKIAAAAARAAGAVVDYIDLRDYPMPLYDGDLEAEKGLPETALELKKLFVQYQGLLIASPEYNSGYSAVLKNTIDWLSRPAAATEKPLAAFAGKKAALMSASPGALGGLRGLYQLRELLMNLNVMVLPNMRAIGNAMTQFNEQGEFQDTKQQEAIYALSEQLVKILRTTTP